MTNTRRAKSVPSLPPKPAGKSRKHLSLSAEAVAQGTMIAGSQKRSFTGMAEWLIAQEHERLFGKPAEGAANGLANAA